jgi:hypothetical protein
LAVSTASNQIIVQCFQIVVRHHAGEAGRIDQDVGASAGLADRGRDLADLARVLERQMHCHMAAAGQFGDQRRRPVGPFVVADYHPRPCRRQTAHARSTNAAAAPRHHRHLAGQQSLVPHRHFNAPHPMAAA